MDLFNAVGSSALCNLCQVLGYKKYDEIEIVLRKFVKRVLRVECGIKSMFSFTLRCHMNYILDIIFKKNQSRFPNLFRKIAIEVKLEWFQEWVRLGEQCGSWDVPEERVWKDCMVYMIC